MKQLAILAAVIASFAAVSAAQAHPVQVQKHWNPTLESPVFQGD